jgi:N-acetylmuramoyl-L-alanine amidase
VRPIEPLPDIARRRDGEAGATPGAVATRTAMGVGLLAMAAPAAYTVEPGDTLSGIALEQGTSVEVLADLNGLDDPDHVVAGSELELPGTQEQGSDEAAVDEADEAAADEPADEPVAGGADEVATLLEEAATYHGFNPSFVKAVAWQESGWNQDVVSPAGAIGIMQVLPTTGDHVSEQMVGRTLDLHDPVENVAAGVAYLDHLWTRTDGDVEHTLAAYYQGLASVEEHGYFDDTEQYIANVLALRDRF